MATFIGTTGTDTLIGTAGDDLLQPFSTLDRDLVQGLGGADIYDLRRSGTSMTYDVVIDDAGADGAANTIIGLGSLSYSASFGYQGYATALRIDDDLVLHTPNRPYRFRKPARPDYDVEIIDQYGEGHVTSLEAGGVTYLLHLGSLGSDLADLMAGTNGVDSLRSGDGNDWVFGNGGRDTLDAGAGDDTVFGGNGGDTITAMGGNNAIFAENGADRIRTGDGHDRIDAGAGRDKVWAGGGNDRVEGGGGNNRLVGQAGDDVLGGAGGNDVLIGGGGNDTLTPGGGDNRLIGGKGGDTYIIDATLGGTHLIIDKGDAPYPGTFATARNDVVSVRGYDGAWDAMRALSVAAPGDDLVMTFQSDTAAPTQITIQNHFLNHRFAVEKIALGASSLATDFNIVALEGDLNTFSVHDGPDVGGNDIILGTDGADELYGGINNNIYLSGTGADVFLFKDEEDNRGGLDLILDFDVTRDRLDFTEIETLSRSGVTIADNAYGHAVLTSPYESIELRGVSAAELGDDAMIFAL